jgi:16S rRNA (adenine1518-N6/adenine1519-N6)-dimethyltransferase
MTAQTPATLRALLARHHLTARTSLGQHFLADPNIIRKMVKAAGVAAGDRVVEVGAGTGALTRTLWEAGARVVAVEVDRRLAPVLAEVLAGTEVELHLEDALGFDFRGRLEGGGWKMVSNLPYEIGTVLLLDLLRNAEAIEAFTVMVQLEVAQRLTAEAGDEAYGLPSVVVGLLGDARLLFRVPPQVFFPPPRVESALIQIVRRPPPARSGRAIELAAAGFGQRRKMLRSSLKGLLADPAGVLAGVGIDATRRAEELSPADYLRLAEAAP